MSTPGELIMIICAIVIASRLADIARHLGYLVKVVKRRQEDE
jgi:Sec-independent protein translocase protein TatA